MFRKSKNNLTVMTSDSLLQNMGYTSRKLGLIHKYHIKRLKNSVDATGIFDASFLETARSI